MDIEEYIEKIIDNGKIEDMRALSDMLEDALEIIKDYDKKCYKDFEIELYKMAYGNHFNRQMAEEIVHKMKPIGERWSFAETRRIQEERGLNDISPEDFYIVVNSAYNDFKNLFNDDIEMYVRYTIDFIEDEDARKDKTFIYYTQIPL